MHKMIIMKRSIFNSLLKISDKDYLMYNALSDQFLVVNSALEKKWSDCELEELALNMPYFYDQLHKNKFIVESETDELCQLSQILSEARNQNDSFHLIINPTLNCNFRCWYCYETHLIYSKMKENVLKSVKRFVEKTVKQQSGLKYFELSFFGGEPFLQFKNVVMPLIDHTHRVCQSEDKQLTVSFTSNGYLINDEIVDFLNKYKEISINFQITLDGYRNDHNKVRYSSKSGSYDRILENVVKLLRHDRAVVLRVNYTSENIGNVRKILRDLSDPIFQNNNLLHVDFQRVWQDTQKKERINDEIEQTILLFKRSKIKVVNHNCDRIRNSCYADKKNEALINYNGDIYKCTAVDFAKESRYGFLDEKGDIVWEGDMHQKRLGLILNNTTCHSCRIAPLCAGGCSQRALEGQNQKYCMMNFDEYRKDKIILDKFESNFIQH